MAACVASSSPAKRKREDGPECDGTVLSAKKMKVDTITSVTRVSKDDKLNEADDIRVSSIHPLIPPQILIEDLPITEEALSIVHDHRQQVNDIIHGRDDRLVVIVGPCSIHDVDAAIEYAGLLKPVKEALKDDLLIVMRVYFEKPRTTVGWKGLINDPFLDGSFQINKGLRKGRGLLLDLNNLGMPCAVEFLDTITPQYFADLVSWGAIGARTTESQVHRELASGLSCPVGFKNGTMGNFDIAVDAVRAAAHPHRFLGVTKHGLAAIVSSSGNPNCHIVLRGGVDGPNYEKEHVATAVKLLAAAKTVPVKVMVDCSHGNSGKKHTNQPKVATDLALQVSEGSDAIFGIMIESNLVEGRQDIPPAGPSALEYGKSITDACVSFVDTVPMLEALAAAVRHRRARRT